MTADREHMDLAVALTGVEIARQRLIFLHTPGVGCEAWRFRCIW